MTWKQRQRSLFGAEVDFLERVTFHGPVTITAVSSKGPTVDEGLVVTPTSLADHRITGHADRILGIMAGEGRVVTAGEIEYTTWNWVAGDRLFLEKDGELSDLPPLSGFQQQVAVATGPTTVVVSLRPAIILA